MSGFKIVAIIKKRANSTKVEYCYVPHQWEKDGTLYWPKANMLELRNTPDSAPNFETWLKYKCKVKKNNIHGLEEAQLWEEEYVGAVNTEAEESLTINKAQTPRTVSSQEVIITHQNVTEIDKLFNEAARPPVMETDVHSASAIENSFTSTASSIPSTFYNINQNGYLVRVVDDEGSINNDNEHQTVLHQTPLQNPEVNTSNDMLKEIIERQKKLEQKLESKFLNLQATTDKIFVIISELRNKIDKQATSAAMVKENTSTDETLKKKFAFPLNTVEDIYKLDKEISGNCEYRKYLISSYSSVGGVDGNEEGKLIAKKLIAILFTKEILTKFSWTGISRTQGVEKKEAFHSLNGILSWFLEICKNADSRWSESKNENFFKSYTLKHAKQISEAFVKKQNKHKHKYITTAVANEETDASENNESQEENEDTPRNETETLTETNDDISD